jgi:DNA-binding transcriptional LysR family regulator
MELKHLRSFVAVAEEESFTRAADRLHISQPPLSQRIIDLEMELGVKLLERNSRRVTLSEAGKVFFADAQSLLVKLDAAIQTCREVHSGEFGRVSIGFTGRASHQVLPEVLRTARYHFPNVKIEISGPKGTGALQDELLSGSIDAALCFLPLRDDRILSTPCFKCRFSLVVPRFHPLAERPNVAVVDLAEESFVGYPSAGGFQLRRAMNEICHAAGFNARVVRESESSQVLLCLIAAGAGISILPRELANFGDVGDLVFKNIDDSAVELMHGFAWLKQNKNPALQNLLPLIPAF